MRKRASRIVSLHVYKLKAKTEPKAFEQRVGDYLYRSFRGLRGLTSSHFVKGIRGLYKGRYATLWVYENRDSWERLWGPLERPRQQAYYPKEWKRWESFLEPFLQQDPDKITFTAFEELCRKDKRLTSNGRRGQL